jgi:hypothetical protein
MAPSGNGGNSAGQAAVKVDQKIGTLAYNVRHRFAAGSTN